MPGIDADKGEKNEGGTIQRGEAGDIDVHVN
jgi:hypothetical protein